MITETSLTLAVGGAVAGLLVAAVSIVITCRYQLQRTTFYGVLALLPVFYMGFGLIAGQPSIILLEFLVGIPFFLAAALLLFRPPAMAFRIAGAFWLLHGLYDATQPILFQNPGVWAWYPPFCLTVDLVIGLTLLFFPSLVSTPAESHRSVASRQPPR